MRCRSGSSTSAKNPWTTPKSRCDICHCFWTRLSRSPPLRHTKVADFCVDHEPIAASVDSSRTYSSAHQSAVLDIIVALNRQSWISATTLSRKHLSYNQTLNPHHYMLMLRPPAEYAVACRVWTRRTVQCSAVPLTPRASLPLSASHEYWGRRLYTRRALASNRSVFSQQQQKMIACLLACLCGSPMFASSS